MTVRSNTLLEVAELAADAPTAMVVATLAQQAATPIEVTDGKLYSVLHADGSVQIVETPGYTDNHDDARAARPRTVARNVTLLDVDSFTDYLTRNTYEPATGVLDVKTFSTPEPAAKVGEGYAHSEGSLELWADLDGRRILAILDGIEGWRRHQATLKLNVSREWAEWSSVDGKLLDQVKFAEFIEDHLSTIANPDGALLLDMAQTLEATTGAVFKQQSILANGQRGFRWEETVEAKAGQKGDLKPPAELVLVLRPFQGSAPISVVARLRFRVGSSGLAIGIKLAEPDRVLEEAFDQIVADVQALVPVRVNHGRP